MTAALYVLRGLAIASYKVLLFILLGMALGVYIVISIGATITGAALQKH
jgi:hypothetical protein